MTESSGAQKPKSATKRVAQGERSQDRALGQQPRHQLLYKQRIPVPRQQNEGGSQAYRHLRKANINLGGPNSPKSKNTHFDALKNSHSASADLNGSKSKLTMSKRLAEKLGTAGSGSERDPTSSLKQNREETTTAMNQSTSLVSNNSNSWQKSIKREETKNVSWFDWFMCGTCSGTTSCGPTLDRHYTTDHSRAPQPLESGQKSLTIRRVEETSMIQEGDLASQHSSQIFNKKHSQRQPRMTNEELDRILFADLNPPSGISKKVKVSSDNDDTNELKSIHSPQFYSNELQKSDSQRFGEEPERVRDKHNTNQLKRNALHSSAASGEETPLSSNETALIYTGRNLTPEKRGALPPMKPTAPVAQNKAPQRNNFETNHDSSISSDKSIPEENYAENSSPLSELQPSLKVGHQEIGDRQNQGAALGSLTAGLTYSNSIQNTQCVGSELQPESIRTSQQFAAGSRSTTAMVSDFKRNRNELVNHDVSESGQIAEEHSATALTIHEADEDSSHLQLAKLQQQSQASLAKEAEFEGKRWTSPGLMNSSVENEEVVISSIEQAQGRTLFQQRKHDDELQEFERLEAELLKTHSVHENQLSEKTTPIDPMRGPCATQNVKRHSIIEECNPSEMLREQMIGTPYGIGNLKDINFQLDQYRSLNRSQGELNFSDSGNKQHLSRSERKIHEHPKKTQSKPQNHTDEDRKQSQGRSSMEECINIQMGASETLPQPFSLNPAVAQNEEYQSATVQIKPPATNQNHMEENKSRQVQGQTIIGLNKKSAGTLKKQSPNQIPAGQTNQPSSSNSKRSAQQSKSHQQAQNLEKRKNTNASEKPINEVTVREEKHLMDIHFAHNQQVSRQNFQQSDDLEGHTMQQQASHRGAIAGQNSDALQSSELLDESQAKTKFGRQRNQSQLKVVKTESKVGLSSSQALNARQASTSMASGRLNQSSKQQASQVYSKITNVAQINLTVDKSRQQPTTSVSRISETSGPIKSALQQLAKSMRSESMTKVAHAQRERSKSRSIQRDPQMSSDLSITRLSGNQIRPQRPPVVPNYHSQQATNGDKRVRIKDKQSPTNTDVFSDTGSISRASLNQADLNPMGQQSQQAKTPRAAANSGASAAQRRQSIDRIMNRVATSKNAPSADTKREAIEQMRRSFHSQGSSRGRQRIGKANSNGSLQNRSELLSDIEYLDSSMPSQLPHGSNVNDTSTGRKISSHDKNSLFVSMPRDRSATHAELTKAPLPRVQTQSGRVATKTKNSPKGHQSSTATSQVTAVFGQAKQTPKNAPQLVLPTEHSALEYKSRHNLSDDDMQKYLLERQVSVREQQENFKQLQRVYAVDIDKLPTLEEIEKFKLYSSARQSNKKDLIEQQSKQQSPGRLSRHSPDNSSPRNSQKQRTKVNGFFSAAQGNGLFSQAKEQVLQQNGGPMFKRIQSRHFSTINNRSVSPNRQLRSSEASQVFSKRSQSVMQLRQGAQMERVTSAGKLSKIMSQRELSDSKDFRKQSQPEAAAGGRFRHNSALSHLSRQSQSHQRMTAQTLKTEEPLRTTQNRQKLKPAVPRLGLGLAKKNGVPQGTSMMARPSTTKNNSNTIRKSGIYQIPGSLLPGVYGKTSRVVPEESKASQSLLPTKMSARLKGAQPSKAIQQERRVKQNLRA